MRIGLIGRLCSLALALCLAGGARADYPDRPINLVIPVAAGDATDIAARIMAEELTKLLKVPVVVFNMPGAGGLIGANSVAKAAKDGYTLLFTINATLTSNRILNPQAASFDPLTDFTPLGLTTRTPMVIAVRGDASYKTLGEMAAYAKRNPVNVGTAGIGSIGDFTVRIVAAQTGAAVAMVPFKGAAPSLTALQGGHIEGVAVALGLLAPHLKSGVLRAIVTSTKSPEFPAIPTMAELGYTRNLLGVWLAFFAPSGVPGEVPKTLVPAIETVATDPTIAARLAVLGVVQDYQSPDNLRAEIHNEQRIVEEMIKKAGLAKP
ncbi:MAG TPA: tripartite tricarboxylate transporter substrate binding protein [Burkholderiaceae bacterium]|nr:tripartite tricarboxylate transporter substrate binding protein [Burkholderiaceae bacterium]